MYKELVRDGVDGIVKVYGFFSAKIRADEECYILLMEGGGMPLSARLNRANFKSHLRTQRATCGAAVASFNQKGFVHGNITYDHLLLDVKAKKASLISLSKCIQHHDTSGDAFRSQKDEDEQQIRSCLGESKNVLSA
ncbi:unnamed protein product [Cyclocybe aegerita]|uniref:Protein kinase domain-containing protein n=1 Tax=Cyclocybe aegerita TaxID=1973307 RepID=A0A8S0XDM6_CYCAE|nr:unnamed protein product [Cyclocybe aegerita]